MSDDGSHDDLVLDVQGLYASYGSVQVLRSVDFSVRRGEIVALLGTNGAGKSTILRCVSGVMKPDAGRVLLDGEDITALPQRRPFGAGCARSPAAAGCCRRSPSRRTCGWAPTPSARTRNG